MDPLSSFILGLVLGIIVTAAPFIFVINIKFHKAIVDSKKLIERNNDILDQVNRVIHFNNELARRNEKNEELIEAAIKEIQFSNGITK